MSNKAWRTVAFLLVTVPIIVQIIIAFILIYAPVTGRLLIVMSDFSSIVTKIQGVAVVVAILVSIFKIKRVSK